MGGAAVVGLALTTAARPLASLAVEDGVVRVRMRGLSRVWALRSRVEVPLSAVVSVEVAPDSRSAVVGLRRPGSVIPGLLEAGTFVHGGESVFAVIRPFRPAVVVELRGCEFARLVVDVQDPDRVTEELRSAVAERRRRAW